MRNGQNNRFWGVLIRCQKPCRIIKSIYTPNYTMNHDPVKFWEDLRINWNLKLGDYRQLDF